MLKSPLLGKILEQLGSCATEGFEESGEKVRGRSVAAHVDDVRPVCVAVNNDEKVAPCI